MKKLGVRYSKYMQSSKVPLRDVTKTYLSEYNASQKEEEDSTSTTEELSMDSLGFEQKTISEAVTTWLDLHGSQLFALEASKFLAKEKKKEALLKSRGVKR